MITLEVNFREQTASFLHSLKVFILLQRIFHSFIQRYDLHTHDVSLASILRSLYSYNRYFINYSRVRSTYARRLLGRHINIFIILRKISHSFIWRYDLRMHDVSLAGISRSLTHTKDISFIHSKGLHDVSLADISRSL